MEQVELLRVDREHITPSPLVDQEVQVPVTLSADIEREWIQVFNHVRGQVTPPANAFAPIPPRTILITVSAGSRVAERVALLRQLVTLTNVRLSQLREQRAVQDPERVAAARARVEQITRELDELEL